MVGPLTIAVLPTPSRLPGRPESRNRAKGAAENMPEISEAERRIRGPRLVRDKLQGKMFLVPALVTVCGIFCGFLAILSAIRGDYELSTKYIALAFFLDGLDGRIARRLNATSAFGREFDSLSDVVTFGVAPAVLAYSWGFSRIADEFGALIAFSLVVCGATRLARFNVDTEHRKNFVGLPIPGAAAAVASLVYFHPAALDNEVAVSLVLAYTLAVAALMVSTFSFMSLKHIKLTDGNPRLNLFLLSILIALTWYQPRLMLVVMFSGYAFSGPVLYFAKRPSKSAN